jgi:hypothetical protein
VEDDKGAEGGSLGTWRGPSTLAADYRWALFAWAPWADDFNSFLLIVTSAVLSFFLRRHTKRMRWTLELHPSFSSIPKVFSGICSWQCLLCFFPACLLHSLGFALRMIGNRTIGSE